MAKRQWLRSILVLAVMLWGAQAATAAEWRMDAAGPTFADMVNDSPNIVFAQVTGASARNIRVSISKALKGKVHDEVRIAGFKNHKYLRTIRNLKDTFKPGEDWFFFLNAAMIGSVPFEPTPRSIAVKVERGEIKTSIISPVFSEYQRVLDYDVFSKYLGSLIAIQKGKNIDPVFLGRAIELLENAAKDKSSKDAATYLMMLSQVNPGYENEDVLFAMLDSEDVNSRVLALQTLAGIAERLKAGKGEGSKEGIAEGGKKKGAKKKSHKKVKDQNSERLGRIYKETVRLMKTDKSGLVQSTAARALGIIHDTRAIQELAAAIDNAGVEKVEMCEVSPVAGIEAPRKAIIRAIVEFEEDEALDVLEKELLKNKVETFRLILEIFREYADSSLNLLLLDLLQDANFLPRQVAILEYFRAIKDGDTIEGLKKLFLSPDAGSEFIRKSIVEVFEDYREPKFTVEFLIEHGLHDRSSVVRQATARALGKLGAQRAVAEFKEIYFKESNRLAREFYVEALSQIKSRLAYDCLEWLLKKETDRRMTKQIKFALKKSKYLSQ